MKTSLLYNIFTTILSLSLLLGLFMFAGRIISPPEDIHNPRTNIIFLGVPTLYNNEVPMTTADFRVHDYVTRLDKSAMDVFGIRNIPYQWEPYYSPPLVTWTYKWVKNVGSDAASALFILFTIGCLVGCILFSLKVSYSVSDKPVIWANFPSILNLITLLTLSYPSLFTIERGSNNVYILLLTTIGLMTLLKKWWFGLGASLTLSSLLKIYPIFLLIPVVMASIFLILSKKQKASNLRMVGLQILIGSVSTASLVLILLFEPYHLYFTKYLFGQDQYQYIVLPLIDHSITRVGGFLGWVIHLTLWGMTSICFILSLSQWLKDGSKMSELKLIYSFLILSVIMLYFAPVCFDYNLVIAFPFLVFISTTATPSFRKTIYFGLVSFTLGIALPRSLDLLIPLTIGEVSYPHILQYVGIIAFVAALCKISGGKLSQPSEQQ